MASVVAAGLRLLAILVVTAVVTRLLATVGTRTAESTAERILGLVNGFFLVLVYTAVFAVVARYDPGYLAVRITSLQATGVVVNAAAIAVTGTAAVRITNGMLRPVGRRLKPGELSIPGRFTRLSIASLGAILFALGLVFMAREYGLVSYPPSLLLPLTLVALLLNGALDRPLTVDEIGLVRARDPTEDERRRIERCYDRFGRTPGRIVVSAVENDIGVTAAGRGPFRTVGVTEPFLQRVDDEQLAVTLAHADERARRYHGYYPNITFVSLVVTLYALLLLAANLLLGIRFVVGSPLGSWALGAVEIAAGTGLSLLVVAVVTTHARNNASRADEFVVSQFGAETVGEVYREFGDSLWKNEPDEDEKILLTTEPKRSDRLAAFGEASEDGGGIEIADDRMVLEEANRDDTAAEASEPDQSDDTDSETGHQSSSDEDDTVEPDWSWSDAGTE